MRIAFWTLVLALMPGPAAFPQPTPEPNDPQRLIERMSLSQKVGQLSLRGRGSRSSTRPLTDELVESVRAGEVGAVINIMVPAQADRLQRIAVEDSELGIPLLFGRDVIHGFRTIQPIPLGQAATWSPELIERGARMAAIEAAAARVNWTFAPMIDVTRDPRWGRIAESFGEDPWLTAILGAAMIRGFQTDDPAGATSLAACAKHFAAYGAAEGGRDYAGALATPTALHDVYLSPFAAAVDAGVLSMMSSFNDVDGVPASGNQGLLTDLLRGQWGFEGFVVSDWNSVNEMIAHGFSANPAQAARQAVNAGLDLEMMSESFEDHLIAAVRSGRVAESTIDAAVGRILHVKYALGLFDDPYRRAAGDPAPPTAEALAAARDLAAQSFVLLDNDGVLPLAADPGVVALIGPLADAPREQLGTWIFDGRAEDSKTPRSALAERLGEGRLRFASGLEFSRDLDTAGFSEALAAARAADVVVVVAGEEAILSGEAHSRADISLPGAQNALIQAVAEVGKPLVLVVMAGRPIDLTAVDGVADAVLMAWHPGTEAGPALTDVLFGERSPSGRLPVTWPRSSGQIPIYYNHLNTGRPPVAEELVLIPDIPVGAWQSSLSNTSHYLDLGHRPRYPFGHGLSYTTFEYRDLRLAEPLVELGGIVRVEATVANTGDRAGIEVAQLYVRDLVGSRARPVRELKAYQRVELEPGESGTVRFELAVDRLNFWNGEGQVVEAGSFALWVGPDAESGLEARFEVVDPEAEPRELESPLPIGGVERRSPALDALIAADAHPTAVARGFRWSEGPVWMDGEGLLFSDVPADTIYRWRSDRGLDRWLQPSGYTGESPRGGEKGSNGLILDPDGALLLCQHGDRRVARLVSGRDEEPRFETVADRWQERRFNSPNDLVLAADGAVYFTDPPYGLEHGPNDPAREIDVQGVYRVSPEGRVERVIDDLSRPNGVAISPDGAILVVANSDPERAVWMRYPLASDGALGPGEVLADATVWVAERPGLPDGMAFDAAGHLFATGPGGIWIFAPGGEHLGTIRLPRPVANVTFGEDGSTLFATADDLLVRIETTTVGLGFER